MDLSPFDALKPLAGRALETALNHALALDQRLALHVAIDSAVDMELAGAGDIAADHDIGAEEREAAGAAPARRGTAR